MTFKGLTTIAGLMLASPILLATPPECVEQYQRAGAIPGTSSCPETAAASVGGMGNSCTANSALLTYIAEYCGNLDEDINDDQCNAAQNQSVSMVGNPINVATGHKLESEVDYVDHEWGSTSFPLKLARYYNSNTNLKGGIFGVAWRSNFDKAIRLTSSTTTAFAVRDVGGQIAFNLVSGQWVGSTNTIERLDRLLDTNGSPAGWRLFLRDNSVEDYDSQGRLISVTNRYGSIITLTYQGGLLSRVIDQFGRSIEFRYNAQNLVSEMVDPIGQIYKYNYRRFTFGNDSNRYQLANVYYPDETPDSSTDNPSRQYLYAEPAYMDVSSTEMVNYSNRLTGIVDEEGVRYASFGYDSRGRAKLSVHGTHSEDGNSGEKLNASRFDIRYMVSTSTSTGSTSWKATSTNAKGKQSDYTFKQIGSSRFASNVTRAPSSNCSGSNSSYTFDSNGFIDIVTDLNGVITDHDFNASGLEHKRVEAVGRSEQQVIETDWDTHIRLPTEIRRPGLTTEFTYENGRVKRKLERDTTTHAAPYSTAGTVRAWNYLYTYRDSSNRQVQNIVVDGPRTDVQDITSYEFNSNGWLIGVTNAQNQKYTVLDHNGRGQPVRVLDENGIEVAFEYYPRGWLKSRTVMSGKGNSRISYRYDARGLLVGLEKPTGVSIKLAYDSAHRLTSVESNIGERIEYTLDSLGNIESEKAIGADGVIRKLIHTEFDELGRLFKRFSPEGNVTNQYGYDNNGNETSNRDANSIALTQQFDAFNRLRQVQQRNGAQIWFTYDPMGNLETVTDQRNNVTRYIYDGFRNLIQEASPDRGVTVYRYDVAGNLIKVKDARNAVTDYSYDALNRVRTITYPNNADDNVTLNYDEAITDGVTNRGRGFLTSITAVNGNNAAWVYDDLGSIIRDIRTIGGRTYRIIYGYDLAGNIGSIRYPSGREVEYQRNSAGRVELVRSRKSSSEPWTTLASKIVYEPFGPIRSFTYGNGLTESLAYDMHYRPDFFQTVNSSNAVRSFDYVFNMNNELERIADTTNPAHSQSFDYDATSRLSDAQGQYGTIRYAYDSSGNRLTRQQTGSPDGRNFYESYTIPTGSNRLESVSSTGSGGQSRQFFYSAAGSVTSDGKYSYIYGANNRLVKVMNGSSMVAQYVHNVFGQRISKNLGSDTTHFVFGRGHELLSESKGDGTPIRDYVYLGEKVLAMIDVEPAQSAPSADMAVSLHHTRNGSTVDYTIAVTNGGPNAAENVTLTNTVPQGVVINSYTVSSGSCSQASLQLNCSLGIMPNGSVNSLQVRITATPDVDISKTVNAVVATTTADPNSSNNQVQKSGKGCFIATAAFGSYEHEYLHILRSFRDDYLMTNAPGRTFVENYYKYSPPVANWMEGKDSVKAATRVLLLPLIGAAWLIQAPLVIQICLLIGWFGLTIMWKHWQVSGVVKRALMAFGMMLGLVAGNASADQIYYMHTDHLNTPTLVTNQKREVVWEGVRQPFGETQETIAAIRQPLRFPGQYFDQETGLDYNYYRDYDPALGRYVQSDPIGLAGDINTYAYVGGNPILYIDPYGLWRWPDFGSLALPTPVPFVGVNISIDQNGNIYGGPGLGIGYPSFGAAIGWLSPSNGNSMTCIFDEREPTPEELNNFLTGWGFNMGAALGLSWTQTDSGLIITTPGVGAGYFWGPWRLDYTETNR